MSKFGFGLNPGALWTASIYLLISVAVEALALLTSTLVSSHTLRYPLTEEIQGWFLRQTL